MANTLQVYELIVREVVTPANHLAVKLKRDEIDKGQALDSLKAILAAAAAKAGAIT